MRGFIRDIDRHVTTDYGSYAEPGDRGQYRRAGFCLVMTMSLIRGRSQNAHFQPALAYYDRLERESKLVYHVSPYKTGRSR